MTGASEAGMLHDQAAFLSPSIVSAHNHILSIQYHGTTYGRKPANPEKSHMEEHAKKLHTDTNLSLRSNLEL